MELGFEEGAVDDLNKVKKLEPSNMEIDSLLKKAKEKESKAEEERIRMINEEVDKEKAELGK